MAKKGYERNLSRRDLAILDFVARYRVGTEGMLRKVCFSPEDRIENVRRVLFRLEKRGLLSRFECGRTFTYFVMTRRGLGVLGLPRRTPRPLTEQSLPVQIAVASYCVDHGVRRLTNSEFRNLYPELWRPGLQSSNYVLVESDEGLKLSMLIVDRGGAARRIQARVRRIVAQRSGLTKFVELMRARRFRVVVLTGLPEQQAKIDRQLGRNSFGTVEVVTALVPSLAEILTMRR